MKTTKLKIEAKMMVQHPLNLTQSESIDKVVFDFEQWLNNEVAHQAYEKFGVGLRIHLTLIGVGE